MPLSDEVCGRCKTKHGKRHSSTTVADHLILCPGSIVVGYSLRDKRWRGCMGIADKTREPPQWCPYALEHLVEGDKDVAQ